MADDAGLLGRRSECEALDRLVADAGGGASRVLVLRGDPGTGKSALLRYLTDRAPGRRVVSATGVEAEIELAYSGLHQLCTPLLDHLERLPVPQRHALATVFGLSPGPAPDRFLVGVATLSLLAEAAERQPLVCLVDDAQWLDRATAQILAFVARRLLAERLALVCAARTGAGDHVLAGLPELTVGGLAAGDARTLLLRGLPGALDAVVRDQIIAECHGNPLALLELPRTWRPADLAGGYGLPDGQQVAGRIEQSYVRRLRELPAATQLLALAAAAEPLGDLALLDRAARRLGVDLAAAAPAEDAGLLQVRGRVEFAHPLVRSGIYRAATVADRRRVHGALADGTDAGTDPDRRAWHRAQATAGPDEAVAAELERSAGRARARGGLAAAAAFLTRATELTPDRAARAGRALDAGFADVEAGAVEAARTQLAVADGAHLDERQRARTDLLRAQLAFVTGRGKRATPALLAAAGRLDAVDPDLARETYLDALVAALIGSRLNDGVDAVDVARAARATARQADAGATSAARLLDAFSALTGDYARAVPLCRAALDGLRRDAVHPEPRLRWLWEGTILAIARFEHERVRDHRVVLGVGVLGDVEVLLDGPFRVGQEGPVGAHRRAELLQRVVVVGGDRDQPGVGHSHLRLERSQLQMLLVFLRAEVAAGQQDDQRVVALQPAERTDGAGVVGQRVIGEDAAGRDVAPHRMVTLSVGGRSAARAPRSVASRSPDPTPGAGNPGIRGWNQGLSRGHGGPGRVRVIAPTTEAGDATREPRRDYE